MSSNRRTGKERLSSTLPQRISLERLSMSPNENHTVDSTPPPSPTIFSDGEAMDSVSRSVRDGRRRKHMHSSGYSSATSSIVSLRTTVRVLQDCRLSLIHIPLPLYSLFLQPILSLVLPLSAAYPADGPVHSAVENSSYYSDVESGYQNVAQEETSRAWSQKFVNISITPIECSIVCSCDAADKLFQPIIETLDSSLRSQVVISKDDFVVIQVEGEGLDAGRRVLELTSPLALAGVPIFFITTYFSDYILVPAQNRSHVTKALQRRGFVFEKHIDAFVAQTIQPTVTVNAPPPTPPPTTTTLDLQTRTFNLLKQENVEPEVVSNARLLLCAGRRNTTDESIYLGLVKVLLSRPRFLSITLTESESPSLLLLREHMGYFGAEDTLLGSKDASLLPIMLDLRKLPLDSTGIVCGVAGRLAGQGTEGTLEQIVPVGMSYLSTARAGTVMVSEDDIERAMEVLNR